MNLPPNHLDILESLVLLGRANWSLNKLEDYSFSSLFSSPYLIGTTLDLFGIVLSRLNGVEESEIIQDIALNCDRKIINIS